MRFFFLNQPVECLANIQIVQKTRTIKLGMKRAEAIHYFLNWCGSAHVTDDSQNITEASRSTMQVATQSAAIQPAATQPLHEVSDDASSDASSPVGYQTLSKEMLLNTA